MGKKALVFLTLIVLFVDVSLSPHLLKEVGAVSSFPVHNISTGLNYTTIQSAINAVQTVDGNTIRVDAGTYNEALTVDKGVSVVGDNPSTTIINWQVTLSRKNAEIANFTLKGGVLVFVDYMYQDGIKISNNVIIGNPSNHYYGIEIRNNEAEESDYGIIEHDEIRDFSYAGIQISRGSYWTISGNDIHNNGCGIILYSSDSCTITENSIHNTNKTIYDSVLHFEDSSNNVIYHNDFFDNGKGSQVYVSSGANKWDNGNQGNYWDDYQGTDSGNGIGSTPYVIDSSNQDNFPLMHMYNNVPEFPLFLILPLFMIATLLAVILYRKKHAKISGTP